MIGRSTLPAIEAAICSMNAPGVVDVPIRMVGLTQSTTVAKSMIPSVCAIARRSSAIAGQRSPPAIEGATVVRAHSRTSSAGRA
jgi:hypothetical protein